MVFAEFEAECCHVSSSPSGYVSARFMSLPKFVKYLDDIDDES
jgi:hypothetical protein